MLKNNDEKNRLNAPPLRSQQMGSKLPLGTFHPRTTKNKTADSQNGIELFGAKGDLQSVRSSYRNYNSINNQDEKRKTMRGDIEHGGGDDTNS